MPSGDFIQTVSHLTRRIEWLQANRDEVAPYLNDGLECIIFTYSRQEPIDRATTRYGGLPYWSRQQSWPVCRRCSLTKPQPMAFLGQLDFRNQQVCTVSGDVLVFHYCQSCTPLTSDDFIQEESQADAHRKRNVWPELPSLPLEQHYAKTIGWALTWQTALSDTDLVTASDLPEIPGGYAIDHFYGVPHAATDYPTPPEAYGGNIAGEEYTYLNFTLQGTKIGGYGPPIQPNSEVPLDSRGRPMKFIAAFGSVTADGMGEDRFGEGDVLWGDMGSILMWSSQDLEPEEIAWGMKSY